jgi:hypothetical protein
MHSSTTRQRRLQPPEPGWFDQRLREIDLFFQGNDRVHQTMRRVVQKFDEANISYAILGGMAVNAHGHERTTKDVDFLLTAEGLRLFQERYVPGTFTRIAGRPRRFLDPETEVTFDVRVAGMYPGSGRAGPVAFPNPSDVSEVKADRCVVNLTTLIQLKLAARRLQDFADVVNLIHALNLEESFLAQLHPSLHRDFIECLEEKRREDEYEKYQDTEFERLGFGQGAPEQGSSPPSS